jgi:hypothetical protein
MGASRRPSAPAGDLPGFSLCARAQGADETPVLSAAGARDTLESWHAGVKGRFELRAMEWGPRL